MRLEPARDGRARWLLTAVVDEEEACRLGPARSSALEEASGLLLARGRLDAVRWRDDDGLEEAWRLLVAPEDDVRGLLLLVLLLLVVFGGVSTGTVRTWIFGFGSVLGTNCRCLENIFRYSKI